jgi:hypothetical protein
MFRSRAISLVGAGAASALVIASLALIGVLPASAAASTLVFSTQPPTTIAAGANMTFAVNVTAGGASGDTIAITSSNCTLAQNGNLTGTYTASPVTFTNVVIDTGTSCNLIASDTTTSDLGNVTSNAITVTPGTATKIGFKTNPPTSAAASTALTTFTVATEDQYGNVVTSSPGLTDTISIGSSCTLGGQTTAAETAGVATFTALTINTIGTCPLLATDTTAGDTGFTPATFSSVTVSAGIPTKVIFTTPPPATDLTIGSALTTFAVSVEDVNGNVEKTGTGSADSIVITATGCTLGGVTTEPAVAGVATFPGVTVTTAGTCVLTATDVTRGVTAATATTFVGEAEAALAVSSTTGYLDAPLTLTTSGGSGTGAVTYSVTNGTATLCTITNGALTVKTAGTCLVTATKAAATPYAGISSAATTVTISSAPRAVKVAGTIVNGRKTTVTVTGYNFSGRPKVISNVAGFTALVTRDSGRALTITVTVKGKSAAGVKVMTIILANGKRASVRYSLHG